MVSQKSQSEIMETGAAQEPEGGKYVPLEGALEEMDAIESSLETEPNRVRLKLYEQSKQCFTTKDAPSVPPAKPSVETNRSFQVWQDRTRQVSPVNARVTQKMCTLFKYRPESIGV